MKLLLTSQGLRNESITKALFDLAGKPAADLKIAFVPTSANITDENKIWFVDILFNIRKQNFKNLDVVDVSALPKSVWLPRLERADILFFCGGESNHLLRWIIESGLKEELPRLLETRVYVGNSAGIIVTNPTMAISNPKRKPWYEELFGPNDYEALKLVNFYTRPHFNKPNSPHASTEYLENIAKDLDKPLYALDDESAIVVDGDEITVVSEGEWHLFE